MLDKTSTWKKQNVQISQDKQNDKFWTKNEVEEKAFEFIAKFEGLHLKAYWDFKHCSIGYWSRAKSCSEKITEKEAKAELERRRAIVRVKKFMWENNIKNKEFKWGEHNYAIFYNNLDKIFYIEYYEFCYTINDLWFLKTYEDCEKIIDNCEEDLKIIYNVKDEKWNT